MGIRIPRGSRERPRAPARPRAEEIALRLAIGREGIGLELADPCAIACIRVTELSATWPGTRFPVDVSGGVARFRHRRGELQRVAVEVGARAVERWVAPRLRGLVGSVTPDVWIGVGRAQATVCVSATADAASEEVRPTIPVLAFDVHAMAEGDDLLLVVANARGVDLPSPATAMAIACLEAALGPGTERAGAVFVLRRLATMLARALLPEAGARAPSGESVRWTVLGADRDTWILHAVRGAPTATPTDDALRLREVAGMLCEADDALVSGDALRARTAYVDALERAPRHREIARRIVEIDARIPDRAEAALATLREAVADDPAADLGITRGELLARTGDLEGALSSLERAGDTEPAPALAARAYELAAHSTRDPEASAQWLDRALARAPRATTARWERIRARLALGRLEDALGDVEHLEALAQGARRKHAVWLRAGRAWQAAGLVAHAGAIYERALRYVPDESAALAGLGTSLLSEGRSARGVALLTRAFEIGQSLGEPTSRIAVELARALAEKLDDLPSAIARVSVIAADAADAPVARGLEGRWRARLGDLAGAALAFARMRDLAMSMAPATAAAQTRPTLELLLEAAEMERTKRRDPLAAQRHLAAALRLDPHDPEARRAYREVGALVAHGADEREPPPDDPGVAAASAASSSERMGGLDLGLESEPPADEEDMQRAVRVEELTRRLHADPTDDAIAGELASLLEALGRGHELIALLSARLEDATPERRAALAPLAREALERLVARADVAGRVEEAKLYREAIAALTSGA
jgi:cellulose synthase operon protein C